MKIEKLKCDGCSKEYPLDTDQLTVRIVGNEDGKVSSRFIVDGVTIGTKGKSLDFCNLTCLQAYIDAQTQSLEEL